VNGEAVPPKRRGGLPTSRKWGARSITTVESVVLRPAMPVQLICPNLRCRKFLSVPDEVRGKLVKCQSCQTLFRVPDSTKKPAATAAGSGHNK
jgi:hypothetical protein